MLRRLGSTLAALALASTSLVSINSGPVQASSVQAEPAPAAVTRILGDYAVPLRLNDADKNINIPATINKLAGAHINTYAYLICYGNRGSLDWLRLPDFLSAARSAGIEVWVYICPPTESQHPDFPGVEMEPYKLDYISWARAIAELSVTYPNLTGWAIDDFAGPRNLRLYTRAYVERMVTAARNVNPNLKFRPVLYYVNLVGNANMLGAYRYYIDGVIFPYHNHTGGTDMTNSANAEPEIRAVYDRLSCDSGAKCAHFYFPPGTGSQKDWSTSFSQTVTVNPTAPNYELSLDVWDDYGGPTAEYRYARVRIGDTVVWRRDVAGIPSMGTRVTLRDNVLRPLLAGRTSATLWLEMYDAKPVGNFQTSMTFDSLVATGFTVQNGGLEGAAGWTPARSSTAYLYGFVKNMKPTVMTYAMKLSREPVAPTPTYVGAVVTKALQLEAQGLTDGSLIYALNKTGVDGYQSDGTLSSYAATYDVVADIYANYE